MQIRGLKAQSGPLLVLAGAGLACAVGLAGPGGAAPARESVNPWADRARDVLIGPCGSCHRSSLATAKPAALAIFDLDEIPWQHKMDDAQLAKIPHARGIETTSDRDVCGALETRRHGREIISRSRRIGPHVA